MGIMITCRGYNNPAYDAQKNVGAHYTWQNIVGPIVAFRVRITDFSMRDCIPDRISNKEMRE